MLTKVIAITNNKLGYPAYRIAPEGSPTSVFTYEHRFFLLGSSSATSLRPISSEAITKTYYLTYWKEVKGN